MQKLIFIFFGVLFLTSLSAQTNPTLKDQRDSASYGYGVAIGNNILRNITVDLDLALLLQGLTAAVQGQPVALTAEQGIPIFQDYSKTVMGKAGEEFLAKNKQRKEVTTTPSGLQYEVLSKGTGDRMPKASDKVKVHYHGTLIDGSVFDSSVDRGEPATFGLSQVIKGWTEGLQYMRVGDKFRFFIPSNLAYGERSPSPKIPAFSTLIFDVELLEIQ